MKKIPTTTATKAIAPVIHGSFFRRFVNQIPECLSWQPLQFTAIRWVYCLFGWAVACLLMIQQGI
ncbi:MAG: hypothetical protein M3Y65_06930 [Pseudomonadota bacterium]|nr:hypothetical protein [Pseudomonadota bacterium]